MTSGGMSDCISSLSDVTRVFRPPAGLSCRSDTLESSVVLLEPVQ